MPVWAIVLALGVGLVLLGVGLLLAGVSVGLWSRRPPAPVPSFSVPPPPPRRTGPPPIDRTLRPPGPVLTPMRAPPPDSAGPTEWLPRPAGEGDATQWLSTGARRPDDEGP